MMPMTALLPILLLLLPHGKLVAGFGERHQQPVQDAITFHPYCMHLAKGLKHEQQLRLRLQVRPWPVGKHSERGEPPHGVCR